MSSRIADEAIRHGEVMDIAAYLSDRIGGRLPNSPEMRQAEEWTAARLREWQLADVHKEGFDFGRGWSALHWSVRMVTPRARQLISIPIAWTPSTQGTVTADVLLAPMQKDADFATWRGKLAGKIVMVSEPGTGSEPDSAPFQRFSAEALDKLDHYDMPPTPKADEERVFDFAEVAERRDAFLKAEGALGWVRISQRDGGVVHGVGYGHRQGRTAALPGFELAAEDYRRLARLADSGAAPRLEINSEVRFDDSDSKAYNIIADIKGTDTSGDYIMVGGHLDSWVAGDGAADNGAGIAVIMETARILKKLGIRPKRTIRFALWNAEEQGLLGSTAYIESHLAERAPIAAQDPRDHYNPYDSWPTRWPLTIRPGYAKLAAYFNIDNGSGRVRGIYSGGNLAAIPLLRDWMAPVAGLGATRVVAGTDEETDHVFMRSIGIPAFGLIQDPLDYNYRIHHTNLDTFDHLKPDDLKQAVAVLATLLVNAANDPRRLPTMPPPRKKAD